MNALTVDRGLVTDELNDIFRRFNIDTNGEVITTISGRSYKVTHVLYFGAEGVWKKVDAASRGMFCCKLCDGGRKVFYPGDTWLQINRNNQDVKIHDLNIHELNHHPEMVDSKFFEEFSKLMAN